ncbi:hypothetical protein V1460_33195 [Streptomyces sp. SCSIO 30461]|uniref:hypothetical protein n=1 Tax=Streptomyces sp. SCSIO 30461 TaxID=3118085 RepID=UPI0030D29BBD
MGRDIKEGELPEAAVDEAAASSAWYKIIGDWQWDEPAVPLDVMRAAVAAVHAAGGRVAVQPDRRGLTERRAGRRRQP